MLCVLDDKGAGFISIALITLLCVLVAISVLHGLIYVSTSIPFIAVHPIAENRTWLNSFLFQATLCTLATVALLHLLITSFPQYLRAAAIGSMLGPVASGMLIVGPILRSRAFIYIFLIMTVVGLLHSSIRAICVADKGAAQLRIEELRTKLFKGSEGR